MNITNTMPFYLAPQTPRRTLLSQPTRPEPSTPLTKQEKKEAFAKEFYTKEEEPWKRKFIEYWDDTKKAEGEQREMTRDQYLDSIRRKSDIALSNQYSFFHCFKEYVIDSRPGLADKSFSFTLGDDAEIKILDPGKSLSEDDLQWLTKAINSDVDFKGTVRKSARLIMTIVDHDPKFFIKKKRPQSFKFPEHY
ncbi:hypothetical protein BZK31_01885 [Pseudomonas floridensis]|uniref:Uncharacterized protein n=1 Tax=Pseudomonas floridensis TaxID=1958950 RepID=A0A1X0ND72_9PSED|nr:hypothetical protein [Pseudomonas floridensis]ORC61819.1 hypothetical protein BZK31_01885 [Pseudomonas floridensis]